VRDLRLVAILAIAAVAAVIASRLEGAPRRAAVALALLAAPLGLGSVLGSPAALSLAALVGAWGAGSRGTGAAAGVLAGVAVALDHRAVPVAIIFLLLGGETGRRLRGVAFAFAAYLAIVLPVAVLDPEAFAVRMSEGRVPGPGLGLFNILAYRGLETSAAAFALGALASLVAVCAVVWLLQQPWPRTALAGIASLVGMLLAPSLSPEAVAVPLLLLGLAAAEPGDAPPA
jgi:hypothetical protein